MKMDHILESQDSMRAGMSQALTSRFDTSQKIRIVSDDGFPRLGAMTDWSNVPSFGSNIFYLEAVFRATTSADFRKN